MLQIAGVKRHLHAATQTAVATGDSRPLCKVPGGLGHLEPDLLGQFDDYGNPKVRLYTSDVASCQDGHFLVRTDKKKLSKKDHFAYVPYLGDKPGSQADLSKPVGSSHVLKVTGLYAWHQRDAEGVEQVYRFALGTMCGLEPQGKANLGYELNYWNGSGGSRARKPSLLKRDRTVPYQYGVWLDQIDSTLVSTANEQWYIPTLKMAHFG